MTEGQSIDSFAVSLEEGKTKPPARYTEDTLLSAMETAGAKEMPDDAERKGLGTPGHPRRYPWKSWCPPAFWNAKEQENRAASAVP